MYIYKTINLTNNKIYIGQSSKEINESLDYYGSGVLLNRAIKKYGKQHFLKVIIDFANSKDELNKKEKYWIKILKANEKPIGYNIAEGGTGGFNGGMKPETKEKWREVGEDGLNAFQRLIKKNWQERDQESIKNSVDKANNTKSRKLENGLTVAQDIARKATVTKQAIKDDGTTIQGIAIRKQKNTWANKTEDEMDKFRKMRSRLAKIQRANESHEAKQRHKDRTSVMSKETVSAYNILTGENKRISISEFEESSFWVGTTWNGFYEIILPNGDSFILTKFEKVNEFANSIGVKSDWITRRENCETPFKHRFKKHKHLDGIIIKKQPPELIKLFIDLIK